MHNVIGLAVADAGSSRVVYAVVFGLIVIGVVLVLVGIWLIRATRVEPELLAPLERMSDRKWRKGDTDARRSLLDEVRPAGARTPNWQDPQDAPVEIDAPPTLVGAAEGEADVISDGDVVAEPVVVADVVSEPAVVAEPVVEPAVSSDSADAGPADALTTAADAAPEVVAATDASSTNV